MKNNLVVYYSNTGSNLYLAEKIAQSLDCDMEAIQPKVKAVPYLMLTSLLAGLGKSRKACLSA